MQTRKKTADESTQRERKNFQSKWKCVSHICFMNGSSDSAITLGTRKKKKRKPHNEQENIVHCWFSLSLTRCSLSGGKNQMTTETMSSGPVRLWLYGWKWKSMAYCLWRNTQEPTQLNIKTMLTWNEDNVISPSKHRSYNRQTDNHWITSYRSFFFPKKKSK